MKIKIEIEWWNPTDLGGEPDKQDTHSLLEEGLSKVSEMTNQGYTSGELNSEQYRGYWEVSHD